MNSVVLEAVAQRCSVKKVFLEISQNSQENTCARVSFLINCRPEVCNFIKKETLAQVFSCEFCEISKNTFSYRTPLVAASVVYSCFSTGCLSEMNSVVYSCFSRTFTKEKFLKNMFKKYKLSKKR